MKLVTKIGSFTQKIHVQSSASAQCIIQKCMYHHKCDEYCSNITYLSNFVVYGGSKS